MALGRGLAVGAEVESSLGLCLVTVCFSSPSQAGGADVSLSYPASDSAGQRRVELRAWIRRLQLWAKKANHLGCLKKHKRHIDKRLVL